MMKKIAVLCMCVLVSGAGLASASGKGHWGYSGHVGPEHWATLSHEFSLCGSGKNQSPINLSGMVEADLKNMSFAYQNVPLNVVNNGHTIQVNYPKGSHMTVNGHTYQLLQFHFHTPSENLIDGHSFPMEAHLVHSDNEGNLAVIAVMFEDGSANPVVNRVWKHMPKEAGQTNASSGVMVNAMDMLPKNKAYYQFNGSLTTPPCSEGVLWMVMKDTVGVTKAQVRAFKAVMHGDNNRPVQPANARAVLK